MKLFLQISELFHMQNNFDDTVYHTYYNDGTGTESWPFDKEQYLILNIAVGGGWGGQKGIDDTIFPQKMHVDYVRVYQ